MKNIKHLTRKHVESLPKLRAPAGYVYVLQDMLHVDTFKIGKTNHPYRRCYEFGVQIPYDIKPVLVMSTSDASAAETYLHRRYKRLRISKDFNREWFMLSEADLQTISELNLDRIVKNKGKSAAKAKRKSKRARRRKHAKDTGWSEKDWSEEEWAEKDLAEEEWSDDDSAIDRDIDYEMWGLEEANERNWETEDSDIFLPEGDIEDTIESGILSGKNLVGMILSGKDFSNRDLSFANLWGAEFSNTYFVNSDLTAVDLTEALLKDANLTGAIMVNSNLTGANLSGASLIDANLKGTNMTAAIFSGAILTRAKFNKSTILPDGRSWTAQTDITRFTK